MSLQEELKGPPPAKLIVDHVSKWFQQKRHTVHALDDVSFAVAEGEFLVLVGPRCREVFSAPGGLGKIHGGKCARALRRDEATRGAGARTRAESAGVVDGRT